MPFKSKAQQAFMHARHPEIAKEFDKKTSDFGSLPQKVGNSNPNATRRQAIQRRLGNNAPQPGPKSQPNRPKVSPQVNSIVKQSMFKKQLAQAKEKNLSSSAVAKQNKDQMRRLALARRQKK